MLPFKNATYIAHGFVARRPHLASGHLTDIDRAAVRSLARRHSIPDDLLLREVEAEVDWLDHRVPLET